MRIQWKPTLKIIAGVFVFWTIWFFIFSGLNKEAIHTFVQPFGIFGPIALTITLTFISLIPFYNGPVLLTSGFLYGPIAGLVINFIGQLIGQIIVILLVKHYGRPLVESAINKETIEKYQHWVDTYGLWALYFVYVLPGFPDDAITYIIGLSRRPLIAYFPALIFGGIGKANVSFIGHDPIGGFIPLIAMRAIMILAGLITFAYFFWLRPKWQQE